MNPQILNQIYDETITMLSDAMQQALNNRSWLNQLLADKASRKLRSVEAWLELQPKFKVKDTALEEEGDIIDIPDELETHIQTLTVKLKPAKIAAELKLLERIDEYLKHLPKLKIPKTIKLKPANIDAELKILEGIHEYLKRQPKLKVSNQPINYESMFMQKTGLGQEQYEDMQDADQEIRLRIQDFARSWKHNNYKRSQALDSKGNIIELCWKNFKARFKISFDQDLETSIRDYTPDVNAS